MIFLTLQLTTKSLYSQNEFFVESHVNVNVLLMSHILQEPDIDYTSGNVNFWLAQAVIVPKNAPSNAQALCTYFTLPYFIKNCVFQCHPGNLTGPVVLTLQYIREKITETDCSHWAHHIPKLMSQMNRQIEVTTSGQGNT